jgi:outer membrane protein insertion porin family
MLIPSRQAVYGDTIDYNIKLYEGPQATFKNIKISGNDRTKEYVIRRELRTLPGEKFSRSDVIRSQREIANLGFFNQEKIVPDIVPDQENGTVDLTGRLKKSQETSSSSVQASEVVSALPERSALHSIIFLQKTYSAKKVGTRCRW